MYNINVFVKNTDFVQNYRDLLLKIGLYPKKHKK